MRDGGLRQLERQYLPTFHLVSIETPMTGSGVPDMNYCIDGVEGWIENKMTRAWAVKLRVEQIGWIMRRTRAGGNVWIAVRRMVTMDDSLYLFAGSQVKTLADRGMKNAKHALCTSGGPARWDWQAVARLLAAPC
jgi:hypothetical protein